MIEIIIWAYTLGIITGIILIGVGFAVGITIKGEHHE